MKYALVVISLLVNFTYAQCDYSNESQCSSNSNCEWVEDVSYGNCEDIINNFDCGEIEECSWWSGCHGGTYQINNSYCQEIEVLECSNMNKLQCIQDSSCSWNEDIEIGNCSQFDNSENSCTSYPGECFWDEDITYTSCDYPNSGMCNSAEGCYWDCNYGYCDCNGQEITGVDTECIGQYEIDNSYCEEIEMPECSDLLSESNCNHIDECEWVENIETENCYDILDCTGGCTWQDCEALEGCNWYFGTAYYDPSYCYGEHEVDNSYCEEIEIPECSEYSTESNCYHDDQCDWIEDIEFGNCSDYSTGTECETDGNCNWECTQWGSWYTWICYGTYYCAGGNYQIDNSFCEEMEFQSGDINLDGIINIQDIIQIIDIILNNEYNDLADLNDDGNVNILDVLQIVDYIINS